MAQETCATTEYWIGTTTERFTISDTLINESTNLARDPNSGTRTGTTLDTTWVTDNFGTYGRDIFVEEFTYILDVPEGTAHALIILPTVLTIPEIIEEVFTFELPLIPSLHYDIFPITDGTNTYNVYYMRDLTSMTFSKRRFKFDITIT